MQANITWCVGEGRGSQIINNFFNRVIKGRYTPQRWRTNYCPIVSFTTHTPVAVMYSMLWWLSQLELAPPGQTVNEAPGASVSPGPLVGEEPQDLPSDLPPCRASDWLCSVSLHRSPCTFVLIVKTPPNSTLCWMVAAATGNDLLTFD